AARLGSIIEGRGLAPVNIHAWSMGADISLWLAKNRPELVKKLVLVTPALHREIVWLPINFAEWTAPFIAGWAVTPQAVELTYWRVFESEIENKDEFTRQAYYPFHRSPDAFYS